MQSQKRLDYMKDVRERLMFLKKNAELKIELFEGLIQPDEFAAKDVHEFESEEVKKKAQNDKDWYMQSVQSDFYLSNMDYKEGEITCYRCKSKRVHFNQKQIKSADEPMTLFCFCLSCKRTWKIG